ncbi:hypothetical protein G6329_17480 [Vibrio cholerae]|uniref:hypothetical protein n=1 Tax=Vibrio cholerae TaxID=666 RepID=UPI00050C590D|nr:hypothetical protein [Vibrio cholerae]EGR4407593.1 hypothetical protein [Vibrio cholerae]EKF9082621.1 hypothetical protein [Vibrio cholerae]EKF9975252.1 hypothetical protein [Vibrio cholerae]ELH8889882.1 hypothetical protein [Vibrio cholerae]ELK0391747.1 hypothetical protein [Vibrio cholerae]
MPDIEKLRRFCLISSLVASSYFLAGISISMDKPIPLLGLPIKISNPENIKVVLLIMCIYGTLRYFYYAIMLEDSPHRKRVNILQQFHPRYQKINNGQIYEKWCISYIKQIQHSDISDAEIEIEKIKATFPKVGRFRVFGSVTTQNVRGETKLHHIEVAVPIACQLAAWSEDIDYFLPVFMGLFTVLAFMFTENFGLYQKFA